MNPKVEKYYKFIVNDLMRDTYQYEDDRIRTPIHYGGEDEAPFYDIQGAPFKQDIIYMLIESPYFPLDLKSYLEVKYGVREEDFIIIKIMYMKSLLKKYV